MPALQTTRNGGRTWISVCACERDGSAPYIVHWSAGRKTRTVTLRRRWNGMRTSFSAYPALRTETTSGARRRSSDLGDALRVRAGGAVADPDDGAAHAPVRVAVHDGDDHAGALRLRGQRQRPALRRHDADAVAARARVDRAERGRDRADPEAGRDDEDGEAADHAGRTRKVRSEYRNAASSSRTPANASVPARRTCASAQPPQTASGATVLSR